MAKLKIPKKHLDGVAAILALNDIQVQSLASELDAAGGYRDGKLFAAARNVSGLEPLRVAKIFDTVKELYAVREREHMSVDEFANSIAAAMRANNREDLELSDEEQSAFVARFSRLLSSRAFALEAKVLDLKRDVEHVYCSSRVLTDLRPVFGESIDDGPARILVMHTLRIAFHNYGEHNEVYVSMSDSAISKMIADLQRAQEKARLLKAQFVTTSIEAKK